ncbi:MAG TPA: PqqD family protein [Thermomicrobiales bacterium]|jgi:hypothetical protein
MTTSLGVRYRPAGPQIIHELIDGEVVLINLDSGSYYSLDGVSATIWSGLVAGYSGNTLCQYVGAHHAGDQATIANDTERFLGELAAEALIIATDNVAAEHALPEITAAPRPYSPPTLGKYTDMQELITLDPIHEVDETGWPTRQPLASAD